MPTAKNRFQILNLHPKKHVLKKKHGLKRKKLPRAVAEGANTTQVWEYVLIANILACKLKIVKNKKRYNKMVDRIRYPIVSYLPFYYIFFIYHFIISFFTFNFYF